jgi:hypothetical protein
MKSKNTIENEIDAIRDAICEETKGMSPAEFNEYIRRETAPIIKQYHLRVVKSAKIADQLILT